MRILVTGGAGYIGSHTVLELLQRGDEVTVLDCLCNAHEEALRRVQRLTGRGLAFHHADLCNRDAVAAVCRAGRWDACIHFAGLKAVGESVREPLRYYRNNLLGTLNLVEEMAAAGCTRLVFSSSATVYGDPASVPITEDFPLHATNPYGQTKLMIEQILADTCRADPRWRVMLLRYFNPVGAHPSGRIGEDPQGIPNNLVPFIAQVAVGRRPELAVYGGDWSTPDGTGVRDYLHVVDLAHGHLAALDHLDDTTPEGPCRVYNLGTGRGVSVLEMAQAFAAASRRPIPHRIVARRPGDIAACWADPSKAARELGWTARLALAEQCADAWRWQSQNPQGYQSATG